ncbi:AIR synthase family protein [Algoriphagus sp. PAP.12]|uniref:AIR synthase family protein n=1 Tax=Algoriphagus sp. PAP.12 TaxID=2996678 RepID=UPI00227D6F86|nr:AIR synthase family protein [Algoriphagus sp. PAP.12]
MAAFEDFSGKINADLFKHELKGNCGADRTEVICGPQFGVDTAVIDLGNGNALAVSSDPLSLIPSLGMKVSAWLSIHLLVNDMSTTGFAPQYAQFVLNLPSSLSQKAFREYWSHIHSLCKESGIAITGGHTGQIPGQESTIAGGGTMFLQAPKNQILTSNQAQAGDSIIMTKQASLSSTALLAMAFPEYVKENLGTEIQEKASSNFWKLSVLKEALLASKTLVPKKELTAMHDVTESGILGALSEMSDASGLGFRIEKERIPISDEVKKVAELFEINPLISIGAGSMLLAVKKGKEDQLIQKLEMEGIQASVLGTFTSEKAKLIQEPDGSWSPFQFDGKDPYWDAFYNAFKTGKK